MNRLLWLAAVLHIDKLLLLPAGEEVPGWNHPEYPELENLIK